MRLFDLFEGMEDDAEHFDALRKTGFFGSAGAGCIFLARSTGRILLCHRSEYVEQPGDWGNWGGAINKGEDPLAAVQREAHEETGNGGPFEFVPLYVFAKDAFRYFNFLCIVDEEFTPALDWESQGYKWCEFGQWPQPLHFGLVSLFNDADSVAKIKQAMGGLQEDAENEDTIWVLLQNGSHILAASHDRANVVAQQSRWELRHMHQGTRKIVDLDIHSMSVVEFQKVANEQGFALDEDMSVHHWARPGKEEIYRGVWNDEQGYAGFAKKPGIYLIRKGNNAAYGNQKGGFKSVADAEDYRRRHCPKFEVKINQ